MHVRHSIQPATPLNIIDVRFDQGIQIFTASTSTGYAVYRTWPLTLLRKRDLTKGTLSMVQPLHTSSLLFLVGGGRSPLYPPNKVIIWDDALGREVGELEFRERVLGLAARREWLAVALKRRVVVYRFVDGIVARYREWETCVNMRGLMSLATAPDSTLLAIPGRQPGHVQLIHLPPCPFPPPPPVEPSPISPHQPPLPIPAPGPPPMRSNSTTKSPISIILAHTTPLSTLCSPPSGRLLSTTSERGTLIRIWDTSSGKLVRELRRGTDKAEIYGVAFRGDESEVCVWSDKGTVHVFKIGVPTTDTSRGVMSNRHSSLSPLSPFLRLPKYFASEWSYASYRLPGPTAHISLSSALNSGGDHPASEDADEEEKCVVGWIQAPVRIRTRRRRVNPNPPSLPAIPVAPLKGKGSGKGKYRVSDVIALDDEDEDDCEEEEVEEEVMQYQLVALTYSGCWYRLSVPSSSSSSSTLQALPSTPSSTAPTAGGIPIPQPRDRDRTSHHHASSVASASSSSPPSHVGLFSPPPPRGRRSSTSSATRRSKGKDKEKAEADGEKASRQCTLEEFRRFGRWDGWG